MCLNLNNFNVTTMKKRFFPFIFFVTTLLLTGWSGCQNFKSSQQTDGGSWQLLVTGSAVPISEMVDQVAEKSTVYQKGYVVVLDLNLSKNGKDNNKIKQLFYKHKINAVHGLKIDPATQLKPTDLLTIENAAAVLLLPINRKAQAALLNNSDLKKVLQSAYQKEAFIAAKGNEWAKLMGSIYYHQRKDAVKGNTMVRQHKGLGLISNAVVDRMPFYNQFKKGILKDVKADRFVFLGLANNSVLLLGKGRAMVLGGAKVGVLTPGKPLHFYKNGEEFLLQP